MQEVEQRRLMPVLKADTLRHIAEGFLQSYGVSAMDAQVVADSIIDANLAGHDSHGILLLPTYLDRIASGQIRPGASIEVKKETPSSILLDGGWNFGQIVARRAMEFAIQKASSMGIALVSTIRTNHVGRLGQYTTMAAIQGNIAIMMVNSGPAVAPWGGITKKLGTNPISIAIPRKAGKPILLDMATSMVSGGKVLLNEKAGKTIPEGWILDKDGKPTTDPKDFWSGALLPAGAYKGYGLALAIDILCGAINGAGTSNKIKGTNGVFILVLKGDLFVSFEELTTSVEELAGYVRNTPLREGFDKILLPGDPESIANEQRLREGIEVQESLLERLRIVAREKNVPFPE